jgi:hypothetical protein
MEEQFVALEQLNTNGFGILQPSQTKMLFFSEKMAAPTGAAQELASLAVESLNRSRIDPQAAGTMSRRRLFFLQMNSLIVAVLTCLTICIVTLSRISNLPEFLFGPCGILAKLLLQNLSDTTSLANAAFLAATSPPEQNECKNPTN